MKRDAFERDNFENIFADVNKVLVIAAHPDDNEMMVGGSIARFLREREGNGMRAEVRLVVATNGALGSRENEIAPQKLANMRKEEQMRAADVLGIKSENIYILIYEDCSFSPWDNDLIERFVWHIRNFKPELIVTHGFDVLKKRSYSLPEKPFFAINHRDHRAVGEAVVNAVMPQSRDISFFPNHRAEGLEGHIVKKILFSNIGEGEDMIDITEFIEVKREAALAHKSQFTPEIIDSWIKKYTDAQGRLFEKFDFIEMDYSLFQS